MKEHGEQQIQEIDLTLLANFTHQVINPLNGVAGTLDNIIDGTISERRRGQRTRAARAQLEGVITLIRNLAYLSSKSYETSRPDRNIVLPQVIIEAAMYYQEEGKSKGISIDLLDRATQNKVSGHPEVLRQVLMNLFDNAIKYSLKDSNVKIKHWIQRRTSDAIISIKSVPAKPLNKTKLESLFDLGTRGENAREMVASGTGLGLYICRYLMEERMHGSINLQVERDGIVFLLRLPNGEAQ